MGELVIIDAELEPLEPPPPVDLDALVRPVIDAELVEDEAEPVVLEATVIEEPQHDWPDWRSPLDRAPWEDHPPTLLRGGVVTSEAGRAVINACVDYALMPWWRRLVTRRPAGYTSPLADWWEL